MPCAKRKQAHKCLLSFGAGNGNRTSTSRFARAREVRTARIWLQCIPGKRMRSRTSPTSTNFRRILIHIAMCQKKAGTWAGIERTPRALREPGKFAQRGSGFSAFPVSDCGAGLHLHPQTSGGFSSTLPCAKRKQAHKCLLSFGAGNGNRTSTSRFARAREVRTARIWLQCIPGKRMRSRTSPTSTNFRRILIHIAMCQKKAGTCVPAFFWSR